MDWHRMDRWQAEREQQVAAEIQTDRFLQELAWPQVEVHMD